ncbi:MAG: choice-of-anchor B family protein [Planctomycetota bacterium]
MCAATNVRLVAMSFCLLLASQATAQYESSGLELLAQIPVNGTAFDAWGWTDTDTGIEYAMIGTTFGVEFFDISDPTQPTHKGRWLTDGFDFKVYKHYAYSTRDVLDLTVLRGVTTPTEFVSDATYFSSRFHNVFINEQTGFLYGSCPSIRVYDLAEPLAPEYAGTPRGGCHDSMSVVYHGPDARYAGREILFGSQGSSALFVYDVEDKSDMSRIGIEPYGGGRFAHQGWPSEDHRYFFLNDEMDADWPGTRTHIFDIADLEDPQYVGYYAGETSATDHNLYVKGDLLYMANYTAGVRIAKLNDPGTLDVEEIAFFDTFPEHDLGRTFDGAFTVYPFFESGSLVVSDMSRGLFIMRLDLGHDADFNDDGTVGCEDVDALVTLLAAGESDSDYDLTQDGVVTTADLDAWRELAGETLFGTGGEVMAGDANLDGMVDGRDYMVWYEQRFTEQSSWCNGDFDANGRVDGQDFVLWNTHKYRGNAQPVAVPAPVGPPWLWMLALLGYRQLQRT